MTLERTLPLDPAAALLQQLRELKERETAEDIASSAARTHWVKAVTDLLAVLRTWLVRVEQEGLARIDGFTVHITDDDVGAYDAPGLKIELPKERTVWVRPIGTLRVGAQGMLDVVCGSNRALLVLNRAGIWKIRGPGAVAPLVPLDAHVFAQVLGELVL